MKTRIFGIGACLALAASVVAHAKPSIRDTQAWTYNDKSLVSIRKEVDTNHRLHVDQVSDKEAKSKLVNAWQKYQASSSVSSAYRFLYLCCHFRKTSVGFRSDIQSLFKAYPALPSYEWERVRTSIEAFQPYFQSKASKAILLRLLKREPDDTVNMDAYIAISALLTPQELEKALQMVATLKNRYPKAVNFYREMETLALFSLAQRTASKVKFESAIEAYEKLRDEGVMTKKQADIAILSLKHAMEWLRSKGRLKP